IHLVVCGEMRYVVLLFRNQRLRLPIPGLLGLCLTFKGAVQDIFLLRRYAFVLASLVVLFAYFGVFHCITARNFHSGGFSFLHWLIDGRQQLIHVAFIARSRVAGLLAPGSSSLFLLLVLIAIAADGLGIDSRQLFFFDGFGLEGFDA